MSAVVRLTCLVVCVALVAVMPTTTLAEATRPQGSCPVMPSQPALPEYSAEYRGETINFCCDECRQKFLQDPQAYVPGLPQSEANSADGHAPDTDSLLMRLHTQDKSDDWRVFLAVTGGLLAVWWLVTCVVHRGWRTLAGLFLAEAGVCVLVGSLTAACLRAKELDQQLRQARLKDLLHYATFYDFGEPLVPARPPVPPRLQATFYRGNDECSPRLFNGGNYRTCTFRVALCDRDGRGLKHGDEACGPLFIRLEIERAPHTPDFFWHADKMRRYFLTRLCDPFLGSAAPIPDRVNLTTDEPMQRWSAVFPIGRAPDVATAGDGTAYRLRAAEPELAVDGSSDEMTLAGIIYVCEQFANKEQQMVGARYHYAIQYDVDLSGGVVGERSDLWMGALYRSRKVVPSRLPLHEWFSHEPIPVLPRATSGDPDLLGVSDYTLAPATPARN